MFVLYNEEINEAYNLEIFQRIYLHPSQNSSCVHLGHKKIKIVFGASIWPWAFLHVKRNPLNHYTFNKVIKASSCFYDRFRVVLQHVFFLSFIPVLNSANLKLIRTSFDLNYLPGNYGPCELVFAISIVLTTFCR